MTRHNSYWHEHLRLLAVLLGIWFVLSFPLAIVLVDVLDRMRLGGFGLGFWLAQQGCIFVYVILLFVYLKMMDRLDRKHQVSARARQDEADDAG